MPRTRRNFVHGVIDNNPLGSSGTTLTSGGLAALQAVSGGDVAVLVLDPLGTSGNPEIVHVTAHTSSATSATILRGQEGTSSRVHPQGTRWRHVPTVLDWNHQELANRGANDHHAQSHGHTGADGSGTVSFNNLTDLPPSAILPRFFVTALNTQTVTGAETSIGSLVVPSIASPTIQIPAAHCSVIAASAGARPALRIRLGSVSGTLLGGAQGQGGGNGDRHTLAIPAASNDGVQQVAASTARTYHVTLERIVGSGNLDSIGSNSGLSVLVIPDLTP